MEVKTTPQGHFPPRVLGMELRGHACTVKCFSLLSVWLTLEGTFTIPVALKSTDCLAKRMFVEMSKVIAKWGIHKKKQKLLLTNTLFYQKAEAILANQLILYSMSENKRVIQN